MVVGEWHFSAFRALLMKALKEDEESALREKRGFANKGLILYG